MTLNVKSLLRQLVGERNYYSWRAQYNLRKFDHQAKPHLFVHQMGKVGSSSIVHSLKVAGIEKQMVLHWTHFLSDSGLDFLEKLYSEGYGGWNNFPPNIKSHLERSRALRESIKRWQQIGKRSKVITLIRDPMRLNVSGFFQNYAWWPATLLEQCQRQTPGYLTALAQHFFASYPHEVSLTWFDQEIKGVFGIDVFAQAFAQTQGYRHYKGEHADLLVIKLEALDHCAKQAIDSFLATDNFVLHRANTAEQKWYATAYQEFTQSVAIPATYLDQIYGSKFATYFYTVDEIAQFRAKWRCVS